MFILSKINEYKYIANQVRSDLYNANLELCNILSYSYFLRNCNKSAKYCK